MGLFNMLRRGRTAEFASGYGEYQFRWVGQPEGTPGCGVACLAMLLGVSWREALARVPAAYDPAKGGLLMEDLLRVLYENGWAAQQKWERYSPAGSDRPLWPLRPWAPIHVVELLMPSWHAVLMTGDGTVMDPLHEYPRSPRDYPRIVRIVGLWRVP